MARRPAAPPSPVPPAPAPAPEEPGFVGPLVLTVMIVLVTALMLGHRWIPDGYGIGSLVESFLPWLGVPLAILGAIAVFFRSRPAMIAATLSVLAWVALFGPALLPRGAGGSADLRVLSHNVYAANPDPAATGRALREADADVIALQEVTGDASVKFHSELDSTYRNRTERGTLAVYSKYPLSDVRPVDIGMGWVRAIRMTVTAPKGQVTLYVVHLASIRLGAGGLASQRRDDTLRALSAAIAADPARRLILAGDLNTASTDRSLGELTSQLTEAQREAGSFFGFTWPAELPLVRLDHVLSRGLTITGTRVLGSTASDHRPVEASFRF